MIFPLETSGFQKSCSLAPVCFKGFGAWELSLLLHASQVANFFSEQWMALDLLCSMWTIALSLSACAKQQWLGNVDVQLDFFFGVV